MYFWKGSLPGICTAYPHCGCVRAPWPGPAFEKPCHNSCRDVAYYQNESADVFWENQRCGRIYRKNCTCKWEIDRNRLFRGQTSRLVNWIFYLEIKSQLLLINQVYIRNLNFKYHSTYHILYRHRYISSVWNLSSYEHNVRGHPSTRDPWTFYYINCTSVCLYDLLIDALGLRSELRNTLDNRCIDEWECHRRLNEKHTTTKKYNLSSPHFEL